MGLVVGGLGLLVPMFSAMPYYRFSTSSAWGSYSGTKNAWDSWPSVLGMLLLLVGSLAVAAAASGLLNSLGKNVSLVRLGGAGVNSLALLLLVVSAFYWSDYSRYIGYSNDLGIKQTRHVGFFFILLFALAAVALSWYVWMKTKNDIPVAPAGFGQAPQGYGQPPAAPGQPQAPGYGQQPPAPPVAPGGYGPPPAADGYGQPPAPPAPGGYGPPPASGSYGPPQG
jgi:hypothetical protein